MPTRIIRRALLAATLAAIALGPLALDPAAAFTATSAHPLADPDHPLGARPIRLSLDQAEVADDVTIKVQLVPPGTPCEDTRTLFSTDEQNPYVARVEPGGVPVEVVHQFGVLDVFGEWSLCATGFDGDDITADVSATWPPVPVRVTRPGARSTRSTTRSSPATCPPSRSAGPSRRRPANASRRCPSSSTAACSSRRPPGGCSRSTRPTVAKSGAGPRASSYPWAPGPPMGWRRATASWWCPGRIGSSPGAPRRSPLPRTPPRGEDTPPRADAPPTDPPAAPRQDAPPSGDVPPVAPPPARRGETVTATPLPLVPPARVEGGASSRSAEPPAARRNLLQVRVTGPLTRARFAEGLPLVATLQRPARLELVLTRGQKVLARRLVARATGRRALRLRVPLSKTRSVRALQLRVTAIDDQGQRHLVRGALRLVRGS